MSNESNEDPKPGSEDEAPWHIDVLEPSEDPEPPPEPSENLILALGVVLVLTVAVVLYVVFA